MPVFIQHTKSRLYVKTLDAWTQDLHEAADFCELNKALRFSHEFQLDEVQIIIKFFTGLQDWVVTPVEFQSGCNNGPPR